MYKNYIFDLYGTLADIHTDENTPALWQKVTDFYKSNGAEYSPEELKKSYLDLISAENNNVHIRHPEYKYIDIQIEKVFRKLYEDKNVSPTDELVAKTALLFRGTSRDYIKLYDGITELLAALKSVGNVYLLTNAQRAFTWDELGILGIRDIFDGIIISSDEECCKPDICFYKKILDRYSLDPKESIMVGNDPVTDIRGGISAGLDTLYIHTNISPEIDYTTGCTFFIPDGDTLKMKDLLI